MAASFPIYAPSRYAGINLKKGYDKFIKHDDTVDEHLDGLLKTVMMHERTTNEAIDAHIVTWRGMMTKIMAAPYDNEPFEMNATLYRNCIFIEECCEFKLKKKGAEDRYKFETLCTMPRPWGETSREYIENRDEEIVNNKEQYCSVVRTGFGNTIVCLGGEVDAIWDAKPETPGAPINWVELKTSAEINHPADQVRFDRKLMRFWIQSFLLGVPKIIVGFRSRDGILTSVKELETMRIPFDVQSRGRVKWDGNVCISFTTKFLEWLRLTLRDEGVWRIRRAEGSNEIELFRVEEVGHGEIITDSFMNWRIQLGLIQAGKATQEPSPPQPQPKSPQSPRQKSRSRSRKDRSRNRSRSQNQHQQLVLRQSVLAG
ncbi:Decapping nuclease RAI1 [Madurella mycetomatis]|uniref:Decapping nuclease n=1 Tax=Madurella mycetomatis TaxID=100816 RepID=A0A175VQE3_9PEZI|nr:Decapping nuclease RAI1 [Madurella mycetomatis]